MKKNSEEKWHDLFKSLPEERPAGNFFPSIRKEYLEFQNWKSCFDAMPKIQPSTKYEEIKSLNNNKTIKKRRIVFAYITIAASIALLIISGLFLSRQDSAENILVTREVPDHVLDFEILSSDPHALCHNLGLDCDFTEDDNFINNWEELSYALNTLLNSTGIYPQDPFLLNEIIRIENKRIELFNQYLSENII